MGSVSGGCVWLVDFHPTVGLQGRNYFYEV